MKEILPDVYWLEGSRGNIFLFVDEDGLTLVDTGMPRILKFAAMGMNGRCRADCK